jgi:hypothetical protein
MSALFPNVPLAIAGVPAVLRRAGALADAREQLATASRDISNTIAAQRWGIFAQSGDQLLDPDNVVSLEHRAEYRVADYPLEGGSFESYDKVQTPFDMRIAVSKGGSQTDRETFLTTCQALLESLAVYNIVTPERTYLNVNVVGIGMTRNATTGAGMATVELVLREVRQAAKAAYSRTETASTDQPLAAAPATTAPPVSAAQGTTRRPAAVRKVNQGSVQPKRVVISGATLTTTASGRKLFVYDTPPGGR